MLTQAEVKDVFDYQDGKLFWKIKTNRNIRIGDRAGGTRQNGYRRITINGREHLEHRLVFLYHHGWLPKIIDHIDNNRSNNCIKNLRSVTQSTNLQRSKPKGGASKYRGVLWDTRVQKWYVQISYNYKIFCLGMFIDEKEAARAYDKKARELYGEHAGVNYAKI